MAGNLKEVELLQNVSTSTTLKCTGTFAPVDEPGDGIFAFLSPIFQDQPGVQCLEER